jgi:hypothetical protein
MALERADTGEPVRYDDNTRRYIRMYATNVRWNNYDGKREQREEGQKIEMRPCTQKDF